MTQVLSELEAVIFRMRREIAEDIASGIVPASAATYSELHDYVDANGYGGAFEDSAHAVDDVDFWNAAQDEVDEWLRGSRPFAVCISCGANTLDVEAAKRQSCC